MRHRWTAAFLVVVTCAFTARAGERWRAPVDPKARKAAPERPAEQAASVDLIVLFKQPVRGITANAIATRREALDARLADLHRDLDRVDVRRTFHRVLFGASVRVARELRASIGALPYVASVHEDRHFQALLAESVPLINAPKVWAQFGTRGAGITVAVIDTGIDYNHPALGGGFGSGFKVVGGWDFHDDDADPMDETGHGTHVAGIIAANGGGLLGVAPEVSLIAYRALGSGGGYESDVISAIERSVDPDRNGDPSDHVDVVNMSLGGLARPDDPAADAVEAATAAGVLFCIAAGNWGDYGNILTPATAPSAITVGAADKSDAVAAFSSRGPSWDYSIKPEVVAPGVGIVSSMPDGKTAALQGTSMAAPHVTGVAALVKAVHRDWSPAQIKSAIVTSAVPLDGDVMISGAGRIDALNATTITTLASPALVNFGQVDGTGDVWTQARTVVLRNVSTHAQTLTATVRGQRNGVTVSVTPPAVTIAPGESATVSIALTVTNASVPGPQEGSLSFGGRIEWTGGDVPIHVPWAFVKGTFLTITMPDAINDSIAYVLGTKWTTNTDFFWDAARVFWPMEKVDVIVNEIGSPSRHTADRIVAAEQVDTATTSTVSVHLDDARFTVSASTAGENGTPIGSGGGLCTEQFVLAFPQGRKYMHEQSPETRARFGPLSSRVKLYLLHSCEDSARATVHAALHEPMQGLQSSVTSTLAPRWLRQDVRFAGAPGGQLTGVLPTVRFPGSEDSFYFAGGWFYLMRETKPSLTFFYTKSPAPELELMAILNRWTRCYDPGMDHDFDCGYVDNAFVYLNEEDVRVEGDLFFEISPMAYRVPARTVMTLGDAPVWAQVGFYAGPGQWAAAAGWMGPLSELRSVDSQYRMILRDEAGAILGDGTGLIYKYETLVPGTYQIQSIDTHYAVAGIDGTATATATLDLRRTDPYYPTLTGLRVEDANGQQVSVVGRGAAAALFVSVADLVREGDYLRRIPPREESMRVEYRRRGTSEWRPLAPLVHARHYHNNDHLTAGVGTVYRVDLSAVTRDVLGAIDIRVYAEDEGGNSTELQLEPALYIGDRPRHRAVRP